MKISCFDLFSVGIGPSSSHTVGPMRAAHLFGERLLDCEIARIKIDLYGSLALTGKGHGTDKAILLGLFGEMPEIVDPDKVDDYLSEIRSSGSILLMKKNKLPFDEKQDLIFNKEKQLPYHPNGMRFQAFDDKGIIVKERVYFSVGGGFIVDHNEARKDAQLGADDNGSPYPFHSGKDLLDYGERDNKTIAEIVHANEKQWRSDVEIREAALNIWQTMKDCIKRGCHTEGVLPGGLEIPRRAANIYQTLGSTPDPMRNMEWVSLWALAVNEENAAGGRLVTAPTNGAAGIIPAVLNYYRFFTKYYSEEGVITFILTAAAIGILYKKEASISAAEMGCMGEVGVACSMAAAGLTAVLGGTNAQIENAAEIGMEHNLGLTCDPIKGLVQIPCIERNTMGAVKAINAALLAMQGDGTHYVSLDQVIATMRETGNSMKSIYKETSLGGLAVNVPEC